MKEGLTDNTTTLEDPSTDHIIDYSNPIRIEENTNPPAITPEEEVFPEDPPPPPLPPPENNLQNFRLLMNVFMNSFYPYFKKDENGEPVMTGSLDDTPLRFIFEPPQGATGPPGPKGDQGATGSLGLIGATGSQGPKGDKGDKGDKGEKGDKGNKGDTGDKGANVFDISKFMLNGDSFNKKQVGEEDNPPEPVPAYSTLFS